MEFWNCDDIMKIATIVAPHIALHAVKDDPDDNKILECAFESNSDYIITYDNHLLKLKEFCGIPILRPEEFLKSLE